MIDFRMSATQYLNDLKKLSELFGEGLPQVLEMANMMLILQRFVFSKSIWRNINNDRALINDTLTTIYPGIVWNGVKVCGEPIWKFVNQLNESIHNSQKTQGGTKHKAQVITRQGGEFCMLCGSRANLQVDHIVAVNMGGASNSISNLQLLCQRCNSGKSNVAYYDVRIALTVMDRECNQLRYRVLLDHGKDLGERVIGFCEECGVEASCGELAVTKKTLELSYSYVNLKVSCQRHR